VMLLYSHVSGRGRKESVSVRMTIVFYHVYLKHYVPLTHSYNKTLVAVNDERRVNVAITRAKRKSAFVLSYLCIQVFTKVISLFGRFV